MSFSAWQSVEVVQFQDGCLVALSVRNFFGFVAIQHIDVAAIFAAIHQRLGSLPFGTLLSTCCSFQLEELRVHLAKAPATCMYAYQHDAIANGVMYLQDLHTNKIQCCCSTFSDFRVKCNPHHGGHDAFPLCTHPCSCQSFVWVGSGAAHPFVAICRPSTKDHSRLAA